MKPHLLRPVVGQLLIATFQKTVVYCFLVGLVFSWADGATVQADTPFPEPYMTANKGMGAESAEATIDKTAGLPEWVSLSVQQRSRYESISNAFRANAAGSDQIVSLRTLAQGELRFDGNFQFKLEFQDSRVELADARTFLNTTMVNSAEVLEANLQWKADNLFTDGSKSLLRAGRMTMDVGSRRLIARNRFRNVLEGFTGLDWIWQAKDGNQVRAFYTLSTNRLPNQLNELERNNVALDRESLDRRFWGIDLSFANLPGGNKGDLYFFGLQQKDNRELLIQSRELYTPGIRFYRPKGRGWIDFEMESALQFGKSRDTTTGAQDLDHFAYYHHAETGYTFSTSWSPRFSLEYDYSSGDANPKDGKNGTFDSLFGESVIEFGPTSIYSAFARTNINSPGARLQVRPDKSMDAYLSYRTFWLASNMAPWVGSSGLRDITGQSSAFLGHQFYLRAKWQMLPNLFLEGGAVYRVDGDFQKTAPNAPREGNTTYTYFATTISF